MQEGIWPLQCMEKFITHEDVGEKVNIQEISEILCISQSSAPRVPRLESYE